MEIIAEIDSKGMHGPETSNNLPASVGVEFHINLADAIRTAVIGKIKAKDIAKGLAADKDWKMPAIGSTVKEDKAADYIGNHKLKIKLNGEKLPKEIKLVISGKAKEVKPEDVAKINAKAMNKARAELEGLVAKAGAIVSLKQGDSNHKTAYQWQMALGEKKLSGTLYAGDDSHVKEGSVKASLVEWNKAKAALANFLKAQKAK